ncbi:RecQ family ATP-dependent DNA helicase [Comamonas badia]|uniref:RecQ family ATP-dependent DNA helicase n=1 Tax=Comamonas badia TaxID=265291 RepID=UPI0004074896|nr:RecQ family ATP-dependent DNA helicase [Comamonas badia]
MGPGTAASDYIARCLCLDVGTNPHNAQQLRDVGGFRPDLNAAKNLHPKQADFQRQLDALTQDAAFVLGHNTRRFDLPLLAHLYPTLALLQLPQIDTLELSPIAFPQNPYHRLVKDYKLCSTSRNNSARDAQLAHQLLLEQAQALLERTTQHPDEALCLHHLLVPEGQQGSGLGVLFSQWRKAARPDIHAATLAWLRATKGKVCISAQRRLIREWLPDPAWHQSLAYVLAWLRVSGGNSVLPPWVGHSFPQVRELIRALREKPCGEPQCPWCEQEHQLAKLLPRYFPGITAFRATPTTEDGRSLQQAIVENGMAGHPTLAILPTGGGKSLCYQLPALAHYYRSGSVTVVISPLQSLMKDQVDGLQQRGITCAGYLNSLLTPIERRAMLDKLRLGDLGLIFVAPEQFRSTAFAKALMHREVRAWVFDEAHCLSKWGHDFRPDYLYVSRFIRHKQKAQPSPVFCFTATAQPGVIADICAHFEKHLAMRLTLLNGGAGRKNLSYEVRTVPTQAKYAETLRLLQEELQGEGCAIVFCARQKTVEEVATFLKDAGLDCGYFHGGMEPADKRHIQENFIAGQLRVIAATNAFGMGVDKPDVRLVIHIDTPGSLENYLQEAGRAGRDQAPARCVLLYDEADLDVQFRLLRGARLNQHDIRSILKALRSIHRKDGGDGEVVVTSGEILLQIPDEHRIDPEARDADTKVRIAIAWLEEARLLERHENHTRVFPGSLLVGSLDEARAVLQRQLEPQTDTAPYLTILGLLMQAGDGDSLSTDELMLATGKDARSVAAMLRELDRWKLLSNDTEIGVSFYSDPDSTQRLVELQHLEDTLLAQLREAAPDADDQSWQQMHMRRLCDAMRRDSGMALDPERLARLLTSFAATFGEGHGMRGCFALRPGGSEHRQLKLLRNWQEIDTIRRRRMLVCLSLLQHFTRLRKGNTRLVTAKQGELETALQNDLSLADLAIADWGVALSSALLYLDANEVLHLARGKAVFRSAMRIAFEPTAQRRQFNKGDYAELALHYQSKIAQVHVMAEFAKLALHKVQAAMQFILDYFRLDRDSFIRQYFGGRKDVLEMATTEAAHRRILIDLANPEQQAIVTAPLTGCQLVLAGPGSGKTRVIVHRVAWLLRERLVEPEAIMVLAYNRHAAHEIRQRLWQLVGVDAAGVTVQTLHSLAMRITGTSYAVAAERGETIDFSAAIVQATQRLTRAAQGDDGPGGDETSVARDRLLAGLRFVLVDEYQDINGEHYALISALAGRTLAAQDDRLSLMAVGDDDQNIYAFGGASVRYIRQFETDYQAQCYRLLENYRSSAHIIDAANAVIAPARQRMKSAEQLRVNHARREAPPGGEWGTRDPLTQGRVHVLRTPAAPLAEAATALAELQRLQALHAGGSSAGHWGHFAVIARRWDDLDALENLCKNQSIPVLRLREALQIPLHSTREGDGLLQLLRGALRRTRHKRVTLRAGTLARWLRLRHHLPADGFTTHPFLAALAQFIAETGGSAYGFALAVDQVTDALYEFGNGSRRQGAARPNAPLLLLSAHSAKGLEFDHVLVLDSGGWQQPSDEERRLFYVAMTRARLSLTLCAAEGGMHAFLAPLEQLALHTRPQPAPVPVPTLALTRSRACGPEFVVLSWPGYFQPDAPIHAAIARLQVGDALTLQPRRDGKPGWELRDLQDTTVGRMAGRFEPPGTHITGVQVAAIQVRERQSGDQLASERWEIVLPEIVFEKPNTSTQVPGDAF